MSRRCAMPRDVVGAWVRRWCRRGVVRSVAGDRDTPPALRPTEACQTRGNYRVVAPSPRAICAQARCSG